LRSGTEIELENSPTEDSFEVARKAFNTDGVFVMFGTGIHLKSRETDYRDWLQLDSSASVGSG
jgi:hypothetical protein